MSNDALFPAPEPADPDEAIAREEIARYYADRLDEANEALTAAQDVYRARLAEMERWSERGEITPDVVGQIDMAPGAISSHATGRYMQAANRAIYRGGDRSEAERLGEREKALRRWLTAQGHDLGALAEPTPDAGRKRGQR